MDWVGWVIGGVGAVAGIVAAIWAILGHRSAASGDQAAQEALELAKRSEARQTELDDVEWGYRWTKDGELEVFNRGGCAARNVQVRILVDDKGVTCDAGDVEGHGNIVFEVPPYRAVLLARAARAVEREPKDWEKNAGFTVGRHAADLHRFFIKITWSSPAGTPHIYQKMHGTASLEAGYI